MYRILSVKLVVFLSFFAMAFSGGTNKKLTEVYVTSYKHIAIAEMHRTGIPASIKLAQGMLESDLGRSDLASKANNHFGIKCGRDWTGEIYYKHDDDLDSIGQIIESCFRAFASPEESYTAHSAFLTNPSKSSRYGFLFELGSTDYVGWANGLKFSGYASDPTYADKLIKLIESNQLYKYDEPVLSPKQKEVLSPIMASNEVPKKKTSPNEDKPQTKKSVKETQSPVPTKSETRYASSSLNDVKMVYASGGETVSQLANRLGMDVYQIMEYNEMLTSPDHILDKKEIVFLDKKKRSYSDETVAFHTVSLGDDMYAISQKYGIRLESLLAKNNLRNDALPAQGEQISLIKHLPKKQTPKHTFVERFDSFVDLGGLK